MSDYDHRSRGARRPVAGGASRLALALIIAAPLLLAAGPPQAPRAAADALGKAARALERSSPSARDGLVELLDETVIAPMPGLDMPATRASLAARLRQEEGEVTRIEHRPLRIGVSADGSHGFTLGHLSVHRADNSVRPAKYLAYWVKRPAGWRIVAFKRLLRNGAPVDAQMLAPLIPDRSVSPSADPLVQARDAASLEAAERAFAAEAQKIGLGPAFAKHGRSDAVNMGRGEQFTVGAANIGRDMGDAPTSPVDWGPDGVLVAPSGDLGLSWGRIRSNDPAQANLSIPFFTVWQRDDRDTPWRYVAE